MLSSTHPPAVERGSAPAEGGRGEVGRTKLFTMTLGGRYLNWLWFCRRSDCAERSSGDWSSWFVNGNGLYDSPISLFYPNIGKLYALIGPINDFGDWGIGRDGSLISILGIMHHSWRVKFQRRVRPAVVIQIDALHRCLPGLPFKFEIRIQPIFLFQNPIHPLRQCILRAMILLGHAHGQAGLLRHIDVRVRRILAPTVGVVDWLLPVLKPSQRHG